MSADLIPFEYGDRPIRVVQIDGEPWFVAADVCAVLGLGNPRSSLALLDDDERGVHTMDTPGGPQEFAIVSEAGLYSLILRSRKPEAKPFKRWITHDVLPAIRKTGGYIANPADLDEIEVAERYVAALKSKRELETKLAVAAPKAEYVDSFVNHDDATTVRVLANQLGVGEKALRDYLVLHKVIYRKLEGRRWSTSKNKLEPEYSWHARSNFRLWFVEGDQPEAPRFHNGQMRTTLYATPIGKVGLVDLLKRHPIDGAA